MAMFEFCRVVNMSIRGSLVSEKTENGRDGLTRFRSGTERG